MYKITESGNGDPVVSTSAPGGNWQGMCLGGGGTRKVVRPREIRQAPITETEIQQRDLVSGKRPKLITLELDDRVTLRFTERLT